MTKGVPDAVPDPRRDAMAGRLAGDAWRLGGDAGPRRLRRPPAARLQAPLPPADTAGANAAAAMDARIVRQQAGRDGGQAPQERAGRHLRRPLTARSCTPSGSTAHRAADALANNIFMPPRPCNTPHAGADPMLQ